MIIVVSELMLPIPNCHIHIHQRKWCVHLYMTSCHDTVRGREGARLAYTFTNIRKAKHLCVCLTSMWCVVTSRLVTRRVNDLSM